MKIGCALNGNEGPKLREKWNVIVFVGHVIIFFGLMNKRKTEQV